jgi:regulator of protease activity HflC (stomatin/prohibitin superfamily)
LEIHLRLSIRYAPEVEALGVLHQKVGQNYVNKIVVPEVENVLRTLIGEHTAEEIYTAGASVLQVAINESLDQVSERFVTIDDVIIKQITLPPEIEQAIQMKEKEKQIELAYDFKIGQAKKEAERKRIEAQGFRDYNDIVALSLKNKPELLTWQGIQATLNLSTSENAKVVVIGSGKDGLPIILGTGN